MNCDRARELCNAECDAPLIPADAASLALHTESCSACAAYRHQMAAVVRGLDWLRSESEELGAPARQMSQQRIYRVAVRLAGLAAALAAVVGISLYVADKPGPRSVPTMKASVEQTGHRPTVPTRIAMNGESARAYIPVERPTQQANVHVFWLYETGE